MSVTNWGFQAGVSEILHSDDDFIKERKEFVSPTLSPLLGKFGQLMFWTSFWKFGEIGKRWGMKWECGSKEAAALLRILYLIGGPTIPHHALVTGIYLTIPHLKKIHHQDGFHWTGSFIQGPPPIWNCRAGLSYSFQMKLMFSLGVVHKIFHGCSFIYLIFFSGLLKGLVLRVASVFISVQP